MQGFLPMHADIAVRVHIPMPMPLSIETVTHVQKCAWTLHIFAHKHTFTHSYMHTHVCVPARMFVYPCVMELRSFYEQRMFSCPLFL